MLNNVFMRRLFSLLSPGLLVLTASCTHRVPGPGPALTSPVITAYSLRWVDIGLGDGPLAVPGARLTVHYTGWLEDGTKFGSSHDNEEPLTFELGARQVGLGWDAGGLEGMRAGGRRRIIIPYQLAYGEKGRPPLIPPRSQLTFDVELLRVDPIVPPPADTVAALRLFHENIDAIQKRDRTRYLATYLQAPALVRNSPDSVRLGFEAWPARTDITWPDTLITTDLRMISIRPGVVYGSYHYCVVEKGVASFGVAEKVFRDVGNNTWRIVVTTAFPTQPLGGQPPCNVSR